MDDAQTTLALMQTTSLATLIAREIEGMILRGDVAGGERVPEGELAARFGVSRSPVREALRALDAVGLVDVVPNRGAFVRRIDFAEALEVYEVRAALFGQAGRLMAERGSDAAVAALETLHADMAAAAHDHAYDRYVPQNFAFHEAIVDGAGNATLAEQYRMLVKRLRLFRTKNLMFGDTLAHSHREHETIVAAIARRDGTAAFATCFDHVAEGRLRMMARTDEEQRAAGRDDRRTPAETSHRGRSR